jgi:hypothetical protein
VLQRPLVAATANPEFLKLRILITLMPKQSRDRHRFLIFVVR